MRLLAVDHSLHIRPVYLLQTPEEPAGPRLFLTISHLEEIAPCLAGRDPVPFFTKPYSMRAS